MCLSLDFKVQKIGTGSVRLAVFQISQTFFQYYVGLFVTADGSIIDNIKKRSSCLLIFL